MATLYNAPIPYDSVLGYDGLPPIVTAENLPTLALRITDKEGNVSALPEANISKVSFEAVGPGAIEFSVPEGTVGYSLVDDYSVVDLLMNGQNVEDGRWMLRNIKWDEGRLNRPKSFSGKSLLWDRLEKTRVWDDKRYKYDGKTPGHILNDLFASAQLRGAMGSYFTWSFNQSVDSLGNAWPQICTFEYLAGAKYSDIINNMLDRDLIEISLLGNEIRVYVNGKRGNVRNALLVVGEDVTDAPQQSTTEGIVSDVIIVGDEGIIVKRSNPTTASIWGREEDNISQGGTQDVGTLSIIGDAALSSGTGPRIQRTYSLVVHQNRKFLPVRDYQPGDWVRVEHGSANSISLRVMSIVLQQSAGQGWTGSLVLNDKFLDSEIRLAKKVAGILGGASIVGSSMPAPDDVKDTGIPNAPTGLVVNFEQYEDDQGVTKAVLVADWNAVTTNTDDTAANDLEQYRFVWKYSDKDDSTAQLIYSDDTHVSVSPIDTNRDVVAYVYVKDQAGNFSAKSNVVTVNSGGDLIPPEAPSRPVGLSRLKTATIFWDGKDLAGLPMAPDTRHVEVWTSASENVDEFTSERAGVLTASGSLVVSAWTYELWSSMYIKFVAVDYSGNRSAPSAIEEITIEGVNGDDIEENSVTANAIAAGAIGAEHVNAGALDTARLTLGPTMNLVVDPSFNLAEWRAIRDTTQWCENPAAWHFNNLGVRARNGYYLQALSQAAGVNGGRMYVTDWIQSQYGETYYFGVYMRQGEFDANAGATLHLGWEVTKTNGEVITGGSDYAPAGTWTKQGYNLPVADLSWGKIRFFVRADNLTAGDIIMDDWEIRSAVGTTAVAGPRITLTPQGFEAYNTGEQQTVLVESETGDVVIRGQFLSGFAGKRIELNPGATYLPEIRFFADTGSAYAYINAVGTTTTPFIGVNAPDNDPSGSFKLVLTDTNMFLGDFDTTVSNTGTGIIGDQGDGYLYLIGKMNSAPWNTRGLLTGGRFTTLNGVGTANGTTTLTITKPTLTGLSIPIVSPMRITNVFFNYHLNLNSATQWAFRWANHTADNVTTWTDWILFRGIDA